MICIVRNRNKFYKRCMLDIWGMSFTYKKFNKENKFFSILDSERVAKRYHYKKEFIFTFRRRIKFRKKKKEEAEYLLPRCLKHFYIVLKLDQLRKMQWTAVKKYGNFEANFLLLLECRIFMLAYRLHFVTNLFMIKGFLDQGIITVNGLVKYHCNITAKVGDFISIENTYFNLIWYDMFLRFKKRVVFLHVPSYMIINYNLLTAIIWRAPRKEDIYFFLNVIDIFLGAEYYYPSPT